MIQYGESKAKYETVNKVLFKNKVKKLDGERREILNRLEDKSLRLLNLKEEIGNHMEQLNVFEKCLPNILEEQRLVMAYLGEMFNIDFKYKEVTFSN